jgi:hypothetical protein
MGWPGRWSALVFGAVFAAAPRADALVQYGDSQIAGSLYTQSAVQHDSLSNFEYVQQRTLLNFNIQHDFVKSGRAFRRFDVPFVDSALLYLQYRGAFDPVFEIRDRYHDRFGASIRHQVEHENTLRDVYLDVAMKRFGPGRLSLRVGKQQVVWGEADVVRSLDVINPLDFRKNFLLGPDQPNLNEYRIPLWMLKGLYSWGQMGPFANNAIEALYIPGDIEPLRGYVGEVLNFPFDMDRRPSDLPFRRVRHPFAITRIGPGFTEIPAQAVLLNPGQLAGPLAPVLGPIAGPIRADLMWFNKDEPNVGGAEVIPPKNDVPSREWIDHAEVGARFLSQISPFDRTIDLSLNWFYTYSDIPGAFADFPAVADALFSHPGTRDPVTGAGVTFDQRRNLGSQASIWIPAALVYPRTHIFGGTATYSDLDWTGAIWRLELSHQTKDPRIKPRPPFLAEREGEFTFQDFEETFEHTGRTTRGMIGADLFRSFPFLDAILGGGQPFFISGQFFVEYKDNISNTVGTLLSVTDRQKRWNPLYTLLAQYFFKGGRWIPLLIVVYDQDPQQLAIAPFLDYHPRDWFTVKVGTIWYTGSSNNQSSRFLHAFADRDETFIRFQYEF